MRSTYLYILLVIGIPVLVYSCNLEKEVDIVLPDYEKQIVVECYLEPGEPFRLLLTNSNAYFDKFDVDDLQNYIQGLLEQEATVEISYSDQVEVLENNALFNPLTRKVFNYTSIEVVPYLPNEEFNLSITSKDGESITARTIMLENIPIDSIVIEYDEDSMARALTWFTDPVDEENFYRRMLHENTVLDTASQDFILSDDFANEGTIVFGTGFDYSPGDTVINTLYHLNPEHYDYLESVINSAGANGNPFAQPGAIISNVEGSNSPLGIFTSLSHDQVITIIEEP